MNTFRRSLAWLTIALTALFIGTAQAENSKDIGDYVVHYNALTTDFLQPDIAKAHGITRSGSRAMVNVTVMKKVMGLTAQPSRASVTGHAVNLSQQIKGLNFRETSDGGAIYYIADLPVSHEEVLDFQLEVTPEGGRPANVSFRQQFFTR
ncbi:MAG: DUF4426 domain-containing protein [Chromatiales bacterium]|nr:DUF4426 domain-containing protein [Chromatiales bacterium]